MSPACSAADFKAPFGKLAAWRRHLCYEHALIDLLAAWVGGQTSQYI